jgi:predicted nucleic acid-binding protein
MASLVRDLVVMKMPVFIPAGVLAQVFRGTARQHALNAFLKLGNVHIVPLDTATAMRAGILCGESETSDIVDASVVICAHEHGGTKVVTSDPDELTHLDPKLRIVPL